MSLSTLLEAAKYLDYLDSNKQQSPQQQQQQQQPQYLQSPQPTQPTNAKKSNRRQRSSRKDAANTMLAMSLPASTSGPIQMQQGVPIPLVGHHHHNNHHHHHQAASLSSSFTTGSPLSSFASTALLCSKASGVTSASSSTASSLSSSDSSSSCGEILMGDNEFNNQPPSMASSASGKVDLSSLHHHHHQQSHNLAHQHHQHSQLHNEPTLVHKFSGDTTSHLTRYIAATSSGPQLVTMSTSSAGLTSASAPIDGRIRAGHVIQAAHNASGAILGAAGSSFDSRQFTLANGLRGADGQPTFSMASASNNNMGSDNHLSVSPGSCPPLIMARVQPMILNSISPSAHQSIMAFQPATASSPTSSSSSYSRHRELHKTLEKNRRAHLRHCFELLKAELPASECVDKKTSHINIIKSAIRYVLALRQQECEIDNELQRLTLIKNDLTEKLSRMRNNTGCANNDINHGPVLLQQQQPPSSQQPQQQQSDQSLQHNIQHHVSPSQPNMSPTPSTSTSAANVRESPPGVKQEQQQQLPVAEQQLSFLLSQSKID